VFAKTKRTIALDIGASSVKVVELLQRGREARLVNFGMAPLEDETIVDGEIMDRALVIAAIREVFAARGIQRRRVVSAISGRGVIVKKIAMERMSDEEAAEAIYWEAEQHVPYDVSDVVLDFKILNTNLGPTQMQVLLVAAKRNVVMNHAEILREAGLVPDAVDVHAFAVQNAVERNHDLVPAEVLALLNTGAEVCNLSIVRDGTPLYTQDLATGGNRLIHKIQRAHQVKREEAYRALLGPDSGTLDTAALLAEFCSELATAVDKSLTYLQSTGEVERLDRLLLSGGLTRIPGFVERMAAEQEVPVERVNPLQRVRYDAALFSGEDPRQIAPQLAVAVGLGLRRGRAE